MKNIVRNKPKSAFLLMVLSKFFELKTLTKRLTLKKPFIKVYNSILIL